MRTWKHRQLLQFTLCGLIPAMMLVGTLSAGAQEKPTAIVVKKEQSTSAHARLELPAYRQIEIEASENVNGGPASSGKAWNLIFESDFESAFPSPPWTVFVATGAADAYWDDWTCWSTSSDESAGCADLGANGINCGELYPNDMDTWMVAGPFDLSAPGTMAAELDFDFDLNSEQGYDYLSVYASKNGADWYGYRWSGSITSAYTYNLQAVPIDSNQFESFVGESEVWIAFRFRSDFSITMSNGAQVDDVILRANVTPTCTADALEPDNSLGAARSLPLWFQQAHSICPAGDQDWVYFDLPSSGTATIFTGGSTGDDTELWLYNSSGTQLAYDDDGGDGLFSRIEMSLGSGRYYARVQEYGNNSEITGYSISVEFAPLLNVVADVEFIEVNGKNVPFGAATTVQLADLNELINVHIRGENDGSETAPADYSNLTVTIPSLTQSADKSRVVLVPGGTSPDVTAQPFFGAEAAGGDGYADYVLMEGWDTTGWSSGESNDLTFTLRPKAWGSTSLRFRMGLGRDASYSNFVHDPAAGFDPSHPLADCIGFASYQIVVNIEPLPNLEVVGITVDPEPPYFGGRTNITVAAELANTGPGTAYGQFTFQASINGTTLVDRDFNDWPSGFSTSVPIFSGTLDTGSYIVNATIDVGDRVRETSESDNSKNRIVDVLDDQGPPTMPSPIFPASGSSHESVPELCWNGSTDPEGGAVSYDVQVSESAAFATTLWEGLGLQQTCALPAVVLMPGEYFWRVRAGDEQQNHSAWSQPWSFTLEPPAPDPTWPDYFPARHAFRVELMEGVADLVLQAKVYDPLFGIWFWLQANDLGSGYFSFPVEALGSQAHDYELELRSEGIVIGEFRFKKDASGQSTDLLVVVHNDSVGMNMTREHCVSVIGPVQDCWDYYSDGEAPVTVLVPPNADFRAIDASANQAVFIHGVDTWYGGWKDVPDRVETAISGIDSWTITYPEDQRIADSSILLTRVLDRIRSSVANPTAGYGSSSDVYLVAWSMGGLVARQALKDVQNSSRVARLMMIATPNHGSRAAMRVANREPLSFPAEPLLGKDNSAPAYWDMAPGSSFLKSLNSDTDGDPWSLPDLTWPGGAEEDYVVIAGVYNKYSVLGFAEILAQDDNVVSISSAALFQGLSEAVPLGVVTGLGNHHTGLWTSDDVVPAIVDFLSGETVATVLQNMECYALDDPGGNPNPAFESCLRDWSRDVCVVPFDGGVAASFGMVTLRFSGEFPSHAQLLWRSYAHESVAVLEPWFGGTLLDLNEYCVPVLPDNFRLVDRTPSDPYGPTSTTYLFQLGFPVDAPHMGAVVEYPFRLRDGDTDFGEYVLSARALGYIHNEFELDEAQAILASSPNQLPVGTPVAQPDGTYFSVLVDSAAETVVLNVLNTVPSTVSKGTPFAGRLSLLSPSGMVYNAQDLGEAGPVGYFESSLGVIAQFVLMSPETGAWQVRDSEVSVGAKVTAAVVSSVAMEFRIAEERIVEDGELIAELSLPGGSGADFEVVECEVRYREEGSSEWIDLGPAESASVGLHSAEFRSDPFAPGTYEFKAAATIALASGELLTRIERVSRYVSASDPVSNEEDEEEEADEDSPATRPASALAISPNPFNPRVTISYVVESDGAIKLDVFSLSGRRVLSLVDAYREAGEYEVVWDGLDAHGRSAASGVYLFQLQTPSRIYSKRATLLR